MLRTSIAALTILAPPFARGSEGIPSAGMPRLQKNHGAWQLMVDGEPFLMRGGEFSNNVYEAPKDLTGLAVMLDAYKGYALNTDALVGDAVEHLRLRRDAPTPRRR